MLICTKHLILCVDNASLNKNACMAGVMRLNKKYFASWKISVIGRGQSPLFLKKSWFCLSLKQGPSKQSPSQCYLVTIMFYYFKCKKIYIQLVRHTLVEIECEIIKQSNTFKPLIIRLKIWKMIFPFNDPTIYFTAFHDGCWSHFKSIKIQNI